MRACAWGILPAGAVTAQGPQDAGARANALLTDAIQLAARGDTAAALERLGEATRLAARLADAHYRRGMLLARQAGNEPADLFRRRSAEASLERALRIDAGNGAMRSSYGSLAIDCEACHGPGAEHAEAWARKDASKAMPRLERMTPRERNALCGRCHGGPPASTDFAPSDAKHVIAPLEDRLGSGPDGSALGQIYQWPQ